MSIQRSRRIKYVDVFSRQSFMGNPVAVVLDAGGLSAAEMQTIARWTNLSETTFITAVADDRCSYDVRIFTPQSELPFAGHPTLGTAHAALEAGLLAPDCKALHQRSPIGSVAIAVSDTEPPASVLSFSLPRAAQSPLSEAAVQDLSVALGVPLDASISPQLVDVGARWRVARLRSVEDVLACRPNFGQMAQQDVAARATGVVVYAAQQSNPYSLEVRAFAPSCGVNEDPICGSGIGSIGVLLQDSIDEEAASYQITQGQVVGRAGSVTLKVSSGGVSVGGSARTFVDGHLVA